MFNAKRLIALTLVGLVVANVVVIALSRGRPAVRVIHTSAAYSLRVRGHRLVYGPGTGRVVQLRGINRSGTEYECLTGRGNVFDGPRPTQPDSSAMIEEMLNWDIDVVRLPLNEGCWLGSGSARETPAGVYRRAVEAEVKALNEHGLFVILALAWNAAGGHVSDSALPMADAQHSPTFWHEVAAVFKGEGDVLFDLFNQPHDISWRCWLDGCHVAPSPGNRYGYEAAGMQSLIDAVRSTGAHQPLIISGDDYSRDLGGIDTHMPRDPDHSLVFAAHSFGTTLPCVGTCLTRNVDVARRFPVIYTALGEAGCAGSYIDAQMPVLDRHGIGYLAWAWDATASGWNCSTGPALIKTYGGTPTAYGAAFRAHLTSLGEPVRPS